MELIRQIRSDALFRGASTLLLATFCVGCAAPMYHFKHYHSPFAAIAQSNKTYFHSSQTGRIIEKDRCQSYCEPGCFGYEPTCWTKWPEECAGNCPIQGGLLGGEVISSSPQFAPDGVIFEEPLHEGHAPSSVEPVVTPAESDSPPGDAAAEFQPEMRSMPTDLESSQPSPSDGTSAPSRTRGAVRPQSEPPHSVLANRPREVPSDATKDLAKFTPPAISRLVPDRVDKGQTNKMVTVPVVPQRPATSPGRLREIAKQAQQSQPEVFVSRDQETIASLPPKSDEKPRHERQSQQHAVNSDVPHSRRLTPDTDRLAVMPETAKPEVVAKPDYVTTKLPSMADATRADQEPAFAVRPDNAPTKLATVSDPPATPIKVVPLPKQASEENDVLVSREPEHKQQYDLPELAFRGSDSQPSNPGHPAVRALRTNSTGSLIGIVADSTEPIVAEPLSPIAATSKTLTRRAVSLPLSPLFGPKAREVVKAADVPAAEPVTMVADSDVAIGLSPEITTSLRILQRDAKSSATPSAASPRTIRIAEIEQEATVRFANGRNHKTVRLNAFVEDPSSVRFR